MKRDYLDLPDIEAEAAIYTRSRTLDETSKSAYSEMGLMCVEVKRRMLWQHRTDPETGFPCRSWTRWMRVAFPFSYSSAFAAFAEVEKLLEDIPAEDIAQIAPGNLHTLTSLSTAVRSDPKVLAAAKTKKPSDFIEHVQEKHPDQHIASTEWIKLAATPEQALDIREAAEQAIRLGEASSLTEFVWQRAVEYGQAVMESKEKQLTDLVQ